MRQARTRLIIVAVILLALVLTVIFAVLGAQRKTPPPSPTVDIGQVQTQAVLAFANGLTSTAQAMPAATQTHTPEASSPSVTPETPSTPSTASASSTPSCYRLKFLQDITIPDNTILTPAQVFTKTWQVQNTGVCAWQRGFKLILIGGVAMGGSPVVLDTQVNPGSKLELSVKMAAPTNQTGIIQGTWRMIDGGGNQFGDALTTVIVVGSTTGAPPTAAATPTP